MLPQCYPLAIEEWRTIIGFEGYYEVSNVGSIRRIAPGQAARPHRILKLSLNPHGYLQTSLTRPEGIRKTVLPHKLVAVSFLGKRPPRMEVNHIDGCKVNNRLSNLEYLTPSEHSRHSIRSGIRGRTCKLTPEQVKEQSGF